MVLHPKTYQSPVTTTRVINVLGWVSLRANMDDMEKEKFLTLEGLEL
jgi:hypothetical protein